VLTPTDKRRLDICADRIADPTISQADLGKKYNLSRQSIVVALNWGRDQGFFTADSSRKLNEHILRLTRIRDALVDEMLHAIKKARAKPPKNKKLHLVDDTYNYQKNIVRLSKSIMDYETRIMELENIYHKIHVHEIVGKVEHKHGLSDALQQELEKITGEKYKPNGNGERNVTHSITNND